MPRKTKNYIIEDDEIYSKEDILSVHFSEVYVFNLFSSAENSISVLARFGLLPNKRICHECSTDVPIYFNLTYRKNSPDGYVWFCSLCKKSASCRKDSIFEDCKIPLQKLLVLFYKYLNGALFTKIADDLDINRHTAAEWGYFVREKIFENMANNNDLLGGIGHDNIPKIVEIDESLFFRRKYHRGRQREDQWFVGGIERNSKKCFIVPVANRNKETMKAIIVRNILPGTICITDKWAAYSAAFADLPNYTHKSVNHSSNFVDPEDRAIHTQNIEALWSRSKFFLRSRSGIGAEEYNEYIIQYIWQYKIPSNLRFNHFLNLLN